DQLMATLSTLAFFAQIGIGDFDPPGALGTAEKSHGLSTRDGYSGALPTAPVVAHLLAFLKKRPPCLPKKCISRFHPTKRPLRARSFRVGVAPKQFPCKFAVQIIHTPTQWKKLSASGRQRGRQLSLREIWTYGEKSSWRPSVSQLLFCQSQR